MQLPVINTTYQREAMIVQKSWLLFTIVEIPVPEEPFSFRLEIHKCSELFKFRLSTGAIRLHPTFHQRDREDADHQ